jgi:DNA-binding NarL/FixJ family response regulator
MTTSAPILICSSHALAAAGLAGLLREGGYAVLPVAGSEGDCFQAARDEKPALALLAGSIVDPGLIRKFADEGIPVAVIVGLESGALLREAYMAGAKACISADVSPQQLLQSVELVLQGATVLSAKPGQLILEAAWDAGAEKLIWQLGGREKQLAILVAQGQTNKEIAEALSISEHTVKVHIGHMLTKLGLRNRQQLAVYVSQEGMLENIPIPVDRF